MKKVIRLTENDLVRIVKRVINEQSLSEKPGDHRPYDKMVIDCLTNKGFKDSGIGKKYDVLMSKTITDRYTNKQGTVTYQVTVSSQKLPYSFWLTVVQEDNQKVLVNKGIDVSKLDCNGLIAELRRIDILRTI